jgi:ribosomal protein S18 acetylase RimI-like enzyme
MTADWEIRAGRESDASTLAAFNAAMALETEHLALDAATVTAGVRAALRDETKARYFVADQGGRVIAQLMITLEWSDWRNGNLWWIQSVYVVPEFRGRGVFRELYGHVRTLARAAGAAGLRLYVERDNTSAQRTYAALGMKLTAYQVMEEIF